MTTTLCSLFPRASDSFILNFVPESIQFNRFEVNELQRMYINDPRLGGKQTTYRLLSILKSIIHNPAYEDHLKTLFDTMQQLYAKKTVTQVLNDRECLISLLQRFQDVLVTSTWLPIEKEYNLGLFLPYFDISAQKYHPMDVYEGLPVEPNFKKIQIANLLQIPIEKLWYPTDNIGFSELRSMQWALLYKYGITPIFPPVNSSFNQNTLSQLPTMSLRQLAGLLINTQNPAVCNEFIKKFDTPSKESKLGGVIMSMLQSVASINGNRAALLVLNNVILDKMSASLGVPLSTECNTCVRTNVSKMDESSLLKCTTQLNRETIKTVLSAYPTFETKKVKITDFKGICPIQVRTILSVFNYYRMKKITIVDSVIVLEPVILQLMTKKLDKDASNAMKPQQQSSQYSQQCSQANVSKEAISRLDQVKSHTSMFNGRAFQDFVLDLIAFGIEAELVNELMPLYYNMNGLRCTLIVATLIQVTFGIQVNANAMYDLLSKLTAADINQIDATTKSNCNINIPTKNTLADMIKTYVDSAACVVKSPNSSIHKPCRSSLQRVDTRFVREVINKLKSGPNVMNSVNKMSLLSQYSFFSYPLIYYWAVERKFDDSVKEDVMLMLSLSEISNFSKTFIMSKLQMRPIDLRSVTYTGSNQPTVVDPNASTQITSPEQFYEIMIGRGVDISCDLNDIATYIRSMQDYNLYKLVQDNYIDNIIEEMYDY